MSTRKISSRQSRISASRLLCAAAAMCLSATATAQDTPTAVSEVSDVPSARGLTLQPTRILRQLRPTPELRLELYRTGVNIHDLGPAPRQLFLEADRLKPDRLGVIRSLRDRPLSIARGSAAAKDLGDGRYVWTMSIRSPGALAMRLHFTDFDVADTEVVVYARDQLGELTHGPYTGRGPDGDSDFWTPSFPGDQLYVEAVGSRQPAFTVAEVGHFDHPPGGTVMRTMMSPPTGVIAFPCELDVMCHGGQVHPLARDATVQLVYPGGPCTGTVLNDLDAETWMPYVLTARHCIASQQEADQIEAVFLYQTATCNAPEPADWYRLPRLIGAQLLAVEQANDMAFLRLYGEVPPGVSYAGSTTQRTDSGHGVHHPVGSWKRAVFLSLRCSEQMGYQCLSLPEPLWFYDYYAITAGAVEGGSSGSGLFDAGGVLHGHLKGEWHPDDPPLTCETMLDHLLVYGRFDVTHEAIGYYLYVGGTIWVGPGPLTPQVENGTRVFPFRTIAKAHDLAWHDIRINIIAGNYPETLRLHKPVTLRAVDGPVVIGR